MKMFLVCFDNIKCVADPIIGLVVVPVSLVLSKHPRWFLMPVFENQNKISRAMVAFYDHTFTEISVQE